MEAGSWKKETSDGDILLMLLRGELSTATI